MHAYHRSATHCAARNDAIANSLIGCVGRRRA
jgi:hypothetical protein